MMMGGPWFGGWWMPLLWIAVIAGVVLVVKSLMDRPTPAPHPEKTPLQILEERYARGEIPEQEFLRMREQLRK